MDIKGSTILITGGTGSFGNRVARFLDSMGPKDIRIFSRDEKKQWNMQLAFPHFRYIIGDVRDRASLVAAMHGVDLVFHAAALKQVPSCEAQPWEAVQTNVVGSQNVCDAAVAAGVRTVVALSTDKAVKPVNAMGMSKAVMEKLVCARNKLDHRTTFCCVRYGNVMGSRGSVIPLFVEQIKSGGPMTVTVPHMTRFLLTLDDSVDLVLHAMHHAEGGEIFVRKAPASTVIDLARAVRKRYASGDPERIAIAEIGIRPGEKIHEVLINEYEMQRAIEDREYFVVLPEYRTLKTESRWPVGSEYTSENTRQLTTYEEIRALLDKMGETEYYV